MILHTDTPSSMLYPLVGDLASVHVATTPAGDPDCFYGWSEPIDRPTCHVHYVVSNTDDDTLMWVATTVKMLGYQVVVVTIDRHGNDALCGSPWPYAYDGDHHH